jgi:hypothetical protein
MGIVMSTFRLKISGFVVLVIAAIIIACVFWSAKEGYNPEADRLYRMALANKEQVNSRDDRDYIIVVDCCQQILRNYPDSPQAEKAKELLQEVPEQFREQYSREISLRYSSKPMVRKSRPLRRRSPRRDDERYFVNSNEVNSSN